ncbi:alanine racemase [Striga asiatica]|uniref:Alanine racemase n=1 Tax=Striga asiatica TaxID=4170 RepID=A0A5A7PT22_STRAF|nr:alanine racemase [Striga asiatica]
MKENAGQAGIPVSNVEKLDIMLVFVWRAVSRCNRTSSVYRASRDQQGSMVERRVIDARTDGDGGDRRMATAATDGWRLATAGGGVRAATSGGWRNLAMAGLRWVRSETTGGGCGLECRRVCVCV